jgi:acyl-CoA synthetase (AMP-forming)/AMP-acid ligase II
VPVPSYGPGDLARVGAGSGTRDDEHVDLPGDVSFVQFSSGTTGIKRGVVVTDAAVLSQLEAYAAAGEGATVAARFAPGSSFGTDNRFYAGQGAVVWQPHWQPDGRDLAPGTYDLGTWRLGASPFGGDDELGARLTELASPTLRLLHVLPAQQGRVGRGRGGGVPASPS